MAFEELAPVTLLIALETYDHENIVIFVNP